MSSGETSDGRAFSAYSAARERLLALRRDEGWWEGGLSSSALATAVAVSALSLAARARYGALIRGGAEWLASHANPDGGWGDTPESPTNLPTTALSRAGLRLSGCEDEFRSATDAAEACMLRMAGGSGDRLAEAIEALYAPDRTFAAPILANMALAGLVEWSRVPQLPFELAALPRGLWRLARLEVVSYALPALIAVGALAHSRRPRAGRLSRLIRAAALPGSLRLLERLQPEGGGFLEAVPLTGFVVMSLAGIGLGEHPVAEKGIAFLERSARPDGSWPIDSNLSVWVTTAAVAALSAGGAYVGPDPVATGRWLLGRQISSVHPYTGAVPGGWAWTHLPGGVPDADDTSGALLALGRLGGALPRERVAAGVRWLLELQNSDGGWPTFCRGWGRLPFDRSSPDLTAHAMRAIARWAAVAPEARARRALAAGFRYLERSQRPDGSWAPLWFGSQRAPDSANPVYGTSRVLLACAELRAGSLACARRGVEFLLRSQDRSGGWGAAANTAPTVEETAVAVEALAAQPRGERTDAPALRGARALAEAVLAGGMEKPSPIGLYFARLWYSERVYPVAWTVGALGRILASAAPALASAGTDGADILEIGK